MSHISEIEVEKDMIFFNSHNTRTHARPRTRARAGTTHTYYIDAILKTFPEQQTKKGETHTHTHTHTHYILSLIHI